MGEKEASNQKFGELASTLSPEIISKEKGISIFVIRKYIPLCLYLNKNKKIERPSLDIKKLISFSLLKWHSLF